MATAATQGLLRGLKPALRGVGFRVLHGMRGLSLGGLKPALQGYGARSDHYVFVDRSLQFWRLGTGVTAVALLLYGLIFEER